MEFKLTFFAIIIAGMVISAIGVIIGGLSVNYNAGVTNDLQGLDKTSELSGSLQGYQGSINPQSGEASTTAEDVTFRGAYGVIANIFSPLRLAYSMINFVAERFGLPDYLIQGIILMMLAAAITTVVAIIFRQLRPNV